MLSQYEDVYAGLMSEILQSKGKQAFAKSFYVRGTLPILSGLPINIEKTMKEAANSLRGRLSCNLMPSDNPISERLYSIHEGELHSLATLPRTNALTELPELILKTFVASSLLANEFCLSLGSVNFMMPFTYLDEEDYMPAAEYMSRVCSIGEWKHKYKPATVSLDLVKGRLVGSYDTVEYTVHYYEPLV